MTVTIYSKPACIQCFATCRAFQDRGINFHVVDISEDFKAYSFVTKLGYRQVPVVVAGDSHWAGFRPDMIDQVQ
ncbi:MAG: glutaredoxin-like protein NrdH [Candidatus Tokpelaia sp. JSC161]|jgi:glutaredoxin-like protein NrdH|nr:MAG: glutaredoxin-like protein NrdH [Candidatus Tokpelaia sp. JSC161]